MGSVVVQVRHPETGGFVRLAKGESPRPKQDRRYQARWREPSGKEKAKNFRAKADAEAFITRIEADKQRGNYVDPRVGDVLLSDFIESYLATVDHSDSRMDFYERATRLYILPALGDRRLGSLTPQDTRDLAASIEAPSMRYHTIKCLTAILARAVQDDILPKNPASGLGIKAPPRKEVRALELSEVEAITEAMVPRYKAMVTLLAWRGLRIGEACGLRVKDLDLMRGRLVVQRTASEVAGVLTEHSTKTRKARAIELPRPLVDLLAAHLAEFSDPTDPEAHVFPAAEGGGTRPNNFRSRCWRPACIAAGIPKDKLPAVHHLRHTAVALNIAAGVNPLAIKEMVGHANITTTLDTYGHLFPSLQTEGLDALASMMTPKEGTVVQFPAQEA